MCGSALGHCERYGGEAMKMGAKMSWWRNLQYHCSLQTIRRKRFARKIGCVERGLCNGQGKHGKCHNCGSITCTKTVVVDRKTLRRQYQPVCNQCNWSGSRGDRGSRRARVENDWGRPIPDQYPGVTRSLLKLFILGEPTEMILDYPVDYLPTLNQSINTLGFTTDCYAEQRANQIVLRKVKP